VLLPVTCLLRRADDVEVIGSAVEMAADGLGHRRIAKDLGRYPETVRGWLRRFAGRAELVRVFFTRVAVRVAVEVVLPQPAGSVLGDAVAAIKTAAGSVASRFDVGAVTAWRVASAVSAGALLAPGWPLSRTESINTSSP
jgi:Homeodomain-like domain